MEVEDNSVLQAVLAESMPVLRAGAAESMVP